MARCRRQVRAGSSAVASQLCKIIATCMANWANWRQQPYPWMHFIRSAQCWQGEGTSSREQQAGTILTEPLILGGAGMRPPLVCSDQVPWPMTVPPQYFFSNGGYCACTLQTHAERDTNQAWDIVIRGWQCLMTSLLDFNLLPIEKCRSCPICSCLWPPVESDPILAVLVTATTRCLASLRQLTGIKKSTNAGA